MLPDIRIAPMDQRFLLWRCLHSGPLSAESIDEYPSAPLDWDGLRRRNLCLLSRLVATYGSCALLAWKDSEVVGMLRFYPKAICTLPEAGGMCLQQAFPNGPSEDLLRCAWPTLDAMAERTLVVHCLMTGSPQQEHNPYQRIGLGTRLATELMTWASERGWQAIEATAYQDLPLYYQITGCAGRSFWEKLGFDEVSVAPEPGFEGAGLGETALAQGRALGLDPETLFQSYTVRRELS